MKAPVRPSAAKSGAEAAAARLVGGELERLDLVDWNREEGLLPPTFASASNAGAAVTSPRSDRMSHRRICLAGNFPSICAMLFVTFSDFGNSNAVRKAMSVSSGSSLCIVVSHKAMPASPEVRI
ncbi:MAG: hypothetical protein WCK89_17930 [bacterium]